MRVCLYLLAVLLVVVLRAAAQTLPIIISAPETILECEQTLFTWSGGDAPYSFYYGAGHNGFGHDDGVETETLVQDGIIVPAVEFDAPASEGLPWRFRVADETQNATTWMYIQRSNSCGSSTSTITGSSSPPPITVIMPPPFTVTPPPFTVTPPAFTTTPVTTTHTPLNPPYATYTHTLSSPHGSTTTANGPPGPTGSTGQPGSTAPTTVIATTTKHTNIPPNPTANPSDPNPNPNAPPGSNMSSENPPSGSGGTSGATDGSTSSGDTYTTPGQPTGGHGGTNGGNPTQTASPIRNTQSQDSAPVPMSAQARVAVIGTIIGAFALFIAFLCFRWRKRHQKKHRPVPVLPRGGNSGDDITIPVTPPYDYSPPMRTNENLPMGVFALQPRPVPSPPRVLPSSKQAMAMVPRRSSSYFGSEPSSPISAGTGTWRSEHGETSRADSASGYPDEEMPPPPLGHSPAPNSFNERYLRPTGPSPMPTPLSLQQLIGRELDNILSSPDNYSPETPLYTPTSISARDHLGRFRVANDTEQSSISGGGVASTSKHPHALTEGSSSQKGERERGSPVLSSADSRGGGQRQRVPISRHEMEYLADLVAARITRDSTQRTEQNQSGVRRHGPPPSYV